MQIKRLMAFLAAPVTLTAMSANAGIIREVSYPKTIVAGKIFKIKVTASENSPSPGSITTYSFNNEKKYSINGSIVYDAVKYKSAEANIEKCPQAFKGKCVVKGKKSKYLVAIPFPQNNLKYQVWVHASGGYTTLKAPDGNKFKWLKKSWKKTVEFSWRGLGSYNFKDTGKTVCISSHGGKIDRVMLMPVNFDMMLRPENTLNSNEFTWKTNISSVGMHSFKVSVQTGKLSDFRKVAVDVIDPAKLVKEKRLKVSDEDQFEIPLTKDAVALNKYPLYNFVKHSLKRKASNLYGLKFNVADKIICLKSKAEKELPATVTFPVEKKAAGLSFLLAEYWQGDTGKEMAFIKVNYQDGKSVKIPLREEFEISGSLKTEEPLNSICIATAFSTVTYHVTLFTWSNPFPEKIITSFTFSNDLKKRSTKDENKLIPLNLTRITSQMLLGAVALTSVDAVNALRKMQTKNDIKSTQKNYGTIDFGNEQGKISPLLFSTNESFIVKTDNPGFFDYHRKMGRIDCKVFRIHSGWTPRKIYTKYGFNEKFYNRFITGLKNTIGSHRDWQLMICFNFIPKYMKPETEEGRKLFVEMCADLVKRVNVDNKLGVKYWEIYNEVYFRKIAEDRSLWKMYNQAAEAMKKVDPTIKTGGYAPCWPSIPMIRDFYKHCHKNVDFISWHKYLTGSSKTPDEYIMRRTVTYGQDAKNIREMVEQVTPGKKVQLALTEYNINWNWKPHDPRQATQTGAVWLASVLTHLITADVDISNNWHSRGGGTFGLFGGGNEIRPAAKVLYLYNQLVKGNYVDSKYSSLFVECLGFINKGREIGIIVINKKNSPTTLDLQLLNIPVRYDLGENIFEGNTLCYSLTDGNIRKEFVNLAYGDNSINLKPYEIKIFIVNKN